MEVNPIMVIFFFAVFIMIFLIGEACSGTANQNNRSSAGYDDCVMEASNRSDHSKSELTRNETDGYLNPFRLSKHLSLHKINAMLDLVDCTFSGLAQEVLMPCKARE